MANICRGTKRRGKEEVDRETSGGGKVLEVEESHFQTTFLLHRLNQLQQPQLSSVPPKKQKTVPPVVPGTHIVGSAGCKDRHNKVSTAKGIRDRRVRLSAHTAIEFYDVQDRLGYDRPSMAVDWLIKNAQSAIDGLDRFPPAPWGPTTTPASVQSLQDSTTDHMFSFDGDVGVGEVDGGYFDHRFFTQREPLQSSTAPPSWMDPIASTSLYHPIESRFRVPPWFQGSEEQDKPGSTSHHQ